MKRTLGLLLGGLLGVPADQHQLGQWSPYAIRLPDLLDTSGS